MFNFLNSFSTSAKEKNHNKPVYIEDKSLNHAQRISINTLEKKKINFNNVVGNFYVESVYDGDTITVIIPVKSHIYNMTSYNQIDEQSDNNKSNIVYFNTVRIRLIGIDTPEIKPMKNLPNREEHIKKAKEAKDFLASQILGKVIRVEFLSNDKYGRPLAKIYKNEICLNDLMVEKGYAKKYYGGTKDIEI